VRDHAGEDLARCRRLGLVVDEDFERGITPLARAARNTILAATIAAIAGATAMTMSHRTFAIVSPEHQSPSDRTRLHRPPLRHTIRPAAQRRNV
jgi:hypothetical protein